MTPGGNASLDDRFAAEMGRLIGPDFPPGIGLAVSGGGDSMAMLALAHNWTRTWGLRLRVVTVDHGLRDESAAEARMVAAECATLGHPHDTLRWHWDGRGNVMAAARAGRLQLIGAWAGGTRHVLMAHTRDDVAETFLMRLARGSGLDGLSAMAPKREVPAGKGHDGFTLLRPCLGMSRAELRHYIRVLQVPWVEDPTNEDPSYDRARTRRQLDLLAEAGIDADKLAATALRLARARHALERRTAEAAARLATEGQAQGVPTGELVLDRDDFAALDRETRSRLLAGALRYVGGDAYAPRADPLEALLDRVEGGGGGTLAGCEVTCDRSALHVTREYAAVRDATAPAGTEAPWDGRWRLSGEATRGLTIAALGETGWRQIPDKPSDAPPHRRARSLPALWDGKRLVACAALGHGPAHRVELVGRRGQAGFAGFLLSD